MPLMLYPTLINPYFPTKLLFLVVTLLVSCNSDYVDIEYKEFSDLKIKGISEGKLLMEGNLRFNNPNDKQVRLSSAEIDVWMDGKIVATIKPSGSLKILRNSEFDIPVEASLDMGEMDWVGSLLSVLGGKREILRFKGYIVLRSWLIPYKIPVDFEQTVKF